MIYDPITWASTMNGQANIKYICIFAFKHERSSRIHKWTREKHYLVFEWLKTNGKTSINNWNRKHSIVCFIYIYMSTLSVLWRYKMMSIWHYCFFFSLNLHNIHLMCLSLHKTFSFGIWNSFTFLASLITIVVLFCSF